MNDGNVRDKNILYYLGNRMSELQREIQECEWTVESANRRIDDMNKRIINLRAHYTSLLNTAIAYGYEVEEDDDQV